MSRLIDPPKTPATSFLSKIEEPRRTNSRLRSSRRESVTNIKPINLINLPEYALRTAEGLVSALALAATQNEKTTPFNAQYTKQISVSFYSLSSVPTPGNRLLGSGGDEHRDQFIFDATGLCEIDLASPAQRNGADKLLKEKAIMEFNRFGYHASENRLRDFWVDKFESVGSRFSSGSQLSKALKIIRKQTSASEDIAFCGLCYCDGDALEVISRFKNCNGALDQDLASVPKLFPVPILLERVMQSFEQPPVPSERSMPGSISKKGSQIELFPFELQLPSLASCGAENTSVPPTKSILDVIRSPKYERPERLVDKVLESTVSMNATSRKCLLRSGERVLWASIQKEQRKLKTPGPFTKRSVE